MLGEKSSPSILTKGNNANKKIENTNKTAITVNPENTCIEYLEISGSAHQVIMEKTMLGIKPESILLSIIELGSSVLMHGSNKATIDSVSSEIDRLIENVTSIVLGKYPQIMEQQTTKMSAELLQYLDPKSAKSVQNQFAHAVVELSNKVKGDLNNNFNDPNSPLTVLKKELVEKLLQVDNKYGELLQHVTAISERLSTKDKLSELQSKLTSKGMEHEQIVLKVLEECFSPFQDLVIDTSQEFGNQGRKTGDFVVSLNLPDIAKQGKIVVEAKNTKLSLQSSLKELDLSLKNRDAEIGILVFGDSAQLPASNQPIRLYENNKILCYISEDSLLPLQISCMLARALASNFLKAHSNSSERIDLGKIADVISKAVEDANKIMKHLTSARKSMDEIETHYLEMRNKIINEVNQLKP